MGRTAVITVDTFPLYVDSYYAQDPSTFDMTAVLGYAYERTKTYEQVEAGKTKSFFEIRWRDRMLANAAYNRTLDHSVVYVQAGSAAQVHTSLAPTY